MLPYRDSKFIRIVLILFFVLAILYAIYEAQGILYGPVISVPQDTITLTEAFTLIRGRAERISELRLNGKPISVTENGEFEEPFLLAAGTNHLVLEARDARGRTAMKTLDILYTPPPTKAQPQVNVAPPSTTTATSTDGS